MIRLAEIPNFRLFLSSLLVKFSMNEMSDHDQFFEQPDIPWFEKISPPSKLKNKSFWFDHLSTYKITAADIHENFTYYAATEILIENENDSDVFTDIGFLVVNTNMGVMVLYPDSAGSLSKLELNFRVEKKMPPFLTDLIEHFPSDDKNKDSAIIKEIKNIGILPIDDYLRRFKRKRLTVVEVD